MKIDFNFQIKTLDNVDAGPASKNLAAHIAATSECTEPLKFYGWAQKLYDSGILDLDEADVDKLKLFIENHRTINVLGKGIFLGVIRDAQLKEKSG